MFVESSRRMRRLPRRAADLTRGNILMLFQKQMRPAFRTIDKGREMGYINFIIR